jgi:prepilin-type N-terminal cleavage/methylation domain-containing protein
MRKTKAFTLVELLVVVVIIGILATFVVLMLASAQKKTRDARAKRSIEAVRDSVEQYIAANDPPSLSLAFGTSVLTAAHSSSLDTKLTSGGATGFSTDANDALGSPVKIKMGTTTYVIKGATSSGSTKCWTVSKDTTGKISDNFTTSTADSAGDCTL